MSGRKGSGSNVGFMLCLFGGILLLLTGAAHLNIWSVLGYSKPDMPSKMENIAHRYVPALETPAHVLASVIRFLLPFGAFLVIVAAYFIKWEHLTFAHIFLYLGSGCGMIQMVLAILILMFKDVSLAIGVITTMSVLGTLISLAGLAFANYENKRRKK